MGRDPLPNVQKLAVSSRGSTFGIYNNTILARSLLYGRPSGLNLYAAVFIPNGSDPSGLSDCTDKAWNRFRSSLRLNWSQFQGALIDADLLSDELADAELTATLEENVLIAVATAGIGAAAGAYAATANAARAASLARGVMLAEQTMDTSFITTRAAALAAANIKAANIAGGVQAAATAAAATYGIATGSNALDYASAVAGTVSPAVPNLSGLLDAANAAISMYSKAGATIADAAGAKGDFVAGSTALFLSNLRRAKKILEQDLKDCGRC